MGDETAALMHNQRQITVDQFSEAERGGEVGCRQTDDLSRKREHESRERALSLKAY